ncbi:MAG: hypothetical protein V1721_03295 [Pseudomonadota bacterium]
MRHASLFILVFMLSVLTLGSSQVPAAGTEGAVLFVAPHRLIIAPDEKVSMLSISNKSSETRRYDLTLIEQVMDKTGVTQRKDTFDYSVKRMIKFMPRRFSLQAGEQQTVRVIVQRPENLPDGDYHSHLLFREVPLNVKDKAQLEEERKAAEEQKTVSFEIRTLYGIGVPVIVQQGTIVADLSLGDPKLVRTGDDKRSRLSLDFTRTGNSESAGLLKAEYVQTGKAPVPVMDPQWIRVYREVDQISRDFPLINIPEDAKGGKIVVSLIKDEADDSKTVRKEVAFN